MEYIWAKEYFKSLGLREDILKHHNPAEVIELAKRHEEVQKQKALDARLQNMFRVSRNRDLADLRQREMEAKVNART